MHELHSVAELERLLTSPDDGQVVSEAQRNQGERDPYRAGLYAAAAFNHGHYDLALKFAEQILISDSVDADTLYLAAWLIVSLSEAREDQEQAIVRVHAAGGADERVVTLELKLALRTLDAHGLEALAPRLTAAGLASAGALAEAEAMFLRKKWKRAAKAYGEFLGDDPWRVVVKERRAYALLRSFRVEEARKLLTDLPVRSHRVHEMMELYAAKRSTVLWGWLLMVLVPVTVVLFITLLFGGLGMILIEGNSTNGAIFIALAAVFIAIPVLLARFRPRARRFAARFLKLDTKRGPYRDLKPQIIRLGRIL